MAASGSELAGFNSKWKKLFDAAASQGISPTQQRAVYNLDLQRLQSGQSYQLSGSEALAAMQSVKAGQPQTQAASPGFFGDLFNDVKDLTTGITGLIGKVGQDFAHPSELGRQISALWENPGTAFNNLLTTLVPGAADIETVLKADPTLSGDAGAKALAQHPITSLLDLLPLGEAAGAGARALARTGTDVATRDILEEASKYKPTDISNEAQAARQAAAEAIPNLARRIVATNPGGLLGLTKNAVLQLPWQDDTIGSFLEKKIGQSSGGKIGATSAAVGRVLSKAGQIVAHKNMGTEEKLTDFAQRHGLNDLKTAGDFSFIVTNYRDDWQTAYADQLQLTPDEVASLGPAIQDYEDHLRPWTERDIERGSLVPVKDPTSGEEEVYANSGDGARVIAKQGAYLKAKDKVRTTAHDLAEMIGSDVPLDEKGSGVALAAALSKLTEPLTAFTKTADETAVRQMFAARKPLNVEVDPDNPEAVRNLLLEGQRNRVTRTEVLRAAKLMGPVGRFQYLLSYISRGDWVAADKTLARIIPTLKTKYLQTNADLAAVLPQLERARDAINFYKKPTTQRTFSKLTTSEAAFKRQLLRTPPARFSPRATDLVQQKLVDLVNGKEVTPEDANMLLDQIANGSWQGEKFNEVVGPQEWFKIKNSVLQQIAKERSEGFNPIFTYSTRAEQIPHLMSSAFDKSRIPTTRAAKSRGFVNPSAVYDPIIGLARREAEAHIEDVMTEVYFGEQGILKRWGVKYDDAYREAMQFAHSDGQNRLENRDTYDHWVNEHYGSIDPHKYISSASAKFSGLAASTPLLVPRAVSDALDAQIKAMRRPEGLAGRSLERSAKILRTSLLDFSLHYQAHIWMGGTTLELLRANPVRMLQMLPASVGMLLQGTDLMKTVTDGRIMSVFKPVMDWAVEHAQKQGEYSGLPVGLSHGIAEGPAESPLKAWNYAKGSKLGKWLDQSLGRRGLHPGTTVATIGANLLRANAYLVGKASEGSVEAGLRFANKVFADMNGLTALERTIIKEAVPFYGWTRHIIQYTLTLPVDNPYRIQILSQLVNQEWNDWNSGIPKSMIYLFQMGGLDPAGNASVVDIRELDPLRSVADTFTMAGFLSSLNPAFQAGLEAIGVNPLTAAPTDLYPTMTLNDFYGNEQASGTNPLSAIEQGIGNYIPEAQVIDHFLSLSSYTRWAKQNDPTAYNNQLWAGLNIPFVPYQVNVNQTLAKTEIAQYNVARDAATAALQDPDPNSSTWKKLISSYSYVPYQGWLVQPNALRQWAFDQVVRAGAWNGSIATISPVNVIVPPQGPKI